MTVILVYTKALELLVDTAVIFLCLLCFRVYYNLVIYRDPVFALYNSDIVI